MAERAHLDTIHEAAVIRIDHPPVNALAPDVLDAIEAAVKLAADDPGVRTIILMGAGRTFVAGADINAFRTLQSRAHAIAMGRLYHAALKRLEDTPKPLVAAIHGAALGGGLELAMACHYRVCTPDARLGLPETQLGIIPGAGGTQRLPRLVGVAAALDMCLGGQPVTPRRALADGLIDRIIEGDLLEGALQFSQDPIAARPRPTRLIESRIADVTASVGAFATARATLLKGGRGARAPFVAVEAIEGAVTLPFDAASEREIELFADCVVSNESRALVHLFFAEREVIKIPDVPKDTPTTAIRSAAVIGAGTMGAGIAMVYANAGIPVYLRDTTPEALHRGLATIRRTYESSLAKGRLTRAEFEARLGRITPAPRAEDLAEVDIAVEAVFEDLDLKKRVFEELGRATRPACVLASNTSTLDIDALAVASARPEKVIGHHFFSPAHVMKLLEIVRGRATSIETIATSLALARQLGKIGVVVGNTFGFVANRLLAFYRREALLLLEEGAGIAQIDQALTTFGMPVGVFAMQDIAGLDVGVRVRQFLRARGIVFPPGPESDIPERLVALGHLGQKTGGGWYRYEAGSRQGLPNPQVDQLAAQAAARRGVRRRTVTDTEIVDRIMTAIVNEAANILDEGMALRAGDIDVIMCHGFGFPRQRGGPLFYGHSMGLETVRDRVRQYRAALGPHWTPAPLIERLVAAGRSYY